MISVEVAGPNHIHTYTTSPNEIRGVSISLNLSLPHFSSTMLSITDPETYLDGRLVTT